MSPAVQVPITGDVLAWAIKEGGFTVAAFAERIGVDVASVHAWISESERPTKTQFAAIVDALRRPSAMFFLPEPPTQTALPPKFRKAPGPHPRNVTPYERIEIRWALSLQDIARDLLTELEHEPVEFPQAGPKEHASEAAARLRSFLAIPGEVERKWKEPQAAFNGLRRALEDLGVFVFQLQLTPRKTRKKASEPGIRGFSAWDDLAPVIAVNTSYSSGAKLFSLAHEAAHLVARSDSSCYGFSGPGSATDPGTEKWCELFAASLLLPESAVDDVMAGIGYARDGSLLEAGEVARIAERLHVSIRAMALRLIDLKYAPNALYGVVEQAFPLSEYKHGKGFGPSRDRIGRRIAETGPKLSELLVVGLKRKSLSLRDSAGYLRVHPSEMRSLESRLQG